MRKYLLNGAVLGAAMGAWSLVKQTREGRRDWMLVLMWLSWALSTAVAIGSIARDSRELERQGK